MSTVPLLQRRATTVANTGLFELDAILPAQFYAGRGSQHWTPEQRLCHAILTDAVEVLRLRTAAVLDVKQRVLVMDTLTWLRATDYEWPFSFVNLCDALGLDVDATRAALLAGRAQRLKRPGVLIQPCATFAERKQRERERQRERAGVVG